MTFQKTLLLTGALLCLGTLPAFAETPDAPADGAKPHKETMFEKQDANKDGKVSQEEFIAHATAKFNEIDANKDGSISAEESQAYRAKKKEKWAEKREDMKEKREEMKEKAKEKMKDSSESKPADSVTTP